MQSVDRIILFNDFSKNRPARRLEIVKLDDDCFMFRFYFEGEDTSVCLFSSDVELKEVRDLIDDTLNLTEE